MDKIPKPPKPRIIESKDLKRLDKWIKYFKDLSPRIKILTYKDRLFKETIDSAKKCAERFLFEGGDGYFISDWPEINKISFFITIDSSKPGGDIKNTIPDTYIFCFSNHSFGITYHEYDGDHEVCGDIYSYSLSSYPPSSLEWSYITEIIIDKVQRYSNVVPEKN